MTQTPSSAYRKFAFISYSHRDIREARWLQRKLEAYRLPTHIHNDIEAGCRYLRPVFRDQSDLNTGVLSAELRLNLQQSKFLILICSRNSARSQWVSDEARAFVEMGRLEQIIPVIIPDGNTPERELFPEFLRNYFSKHPDSELLGVNIGEVGREKTFIRVVSRMLDVSFDTLWQRHRRRQRAILTATSLCSLLICVLAYIFAVPVSLLLKINAPVSNLPVGDKISLTVNGAQYTAPVTNPEFERIKLPGYRRLTSTDIKVSSEYFLPVDTVVATGFGLQSEVTINLHRDNTFAIFAGKVYNDDMQPLEGVEIKVGNHRCISDASGSFYIAIPLEEQREEAAISLSRDGYRTLTRQDEAPGKNLQFILHRG